MRISDWSSDVCSSDLRVTLSNFRVPALAELDLRGEMIHSTVSRGKHLLTRVGENTTIHTHLKMEGARHLYRPETRRSEERRVGKEGGRTVRSRLSPSPLKKK